MAATHMYIMKGPRRGSILSHDRKAYVKKMPRTRSSPKLEVPWETMS
jgi:hypothetical protein